MRREEQLICAAALLVGALGCGDRVVIAHEVLAQDVSSEDLDAGTDASALSSGHEPSHGSGPSLTHTPTKVPVVPRPEEHHPASSAGSDSSVPDASHTAPKIASHH
jgi:hypothetical protein